MPEWVLVLLAAREWGCPPGLVEEQATEEWWGRWVAYRDEEVAWAQVKASK